MKLSKRSESNLIGVHPSLAHVMRVAIKASPHDYMITEGLRTQERQAKLVAEGKSKTLKSKHLKQDDGYGHAVDIMALDEQGKGTWDMRYYRDIAQHILLVADTLGIPITWGGSWSNFKDGPHFQLDQS